MRTCSACSSASEKTATLRRPIRRAVRMTRQAISPLLAMRRVRNMGAATYIRNTPNVVGSIGALSAAERARPSTSRVRAGSMMPSSHSRAVA
jgi:hypothetical protein